MKLQHLVILVLIISLVLGQQVSAAGTEHFKVCPKLRAWRGQTSDFVLSRICKAAKIARKYSPVDFQFWRDADGHFAILGCLKGMPCADR